jgi:hypothetical protein
MTIFITGHARRHVGEPTAETVAHIRSWSKVCPLLRSGTLTSKWFKSEPLLATKMLRIPQRRQLVEVTGRPITSLSLATPVIRFSKALNHDECSAYSTNHERCRLIAGSPNENATIA